MAIMSFRPSPFASPCAPRALGRASVRPARAVARAGVSVKPRARGAVQTRAAVELAAVADAGELAAFVAAPVVLAAGLLATFKIDAGKGGTISKIATPKGPGGAKAAAAAAGPKSTAFSIGSSNTRKTDAATNRNKTKTAGGSVTVYRRSSF